jgi:hypothetical protein
LVVLITATAQSQKIKTGYDKSADFTHFKTYSWANLQDARSRPILFQIVVQNIDGQLQEKGLTRVGTGGDLLLVPEGGFNHEFAATAGTPIGPSYASTPADAAMWNGPMYAPGTGLSPMVNEGMLIVTLIDQKQARPVWQGSIKDKLDLEKKSESLVRVQKSIEKLFRDFPPKKK